MSTTSSKAGSGARLSWFAKETASAKVLIATLLILLIAILTGCSSAAAPVAPTPAPPLETVIAPTPTVAPAPTASAVNTPAAARAAPGSTPSAIVPAVAQPAVTAAAADLANRLGVATSAIGVVEVTSATWPNGALGCPKPGIMYSQIVTPGYRIILASGGRNYEYHSGRGSNVVSCAPTGP
jgi:hypothetical protein